jgi:1-acyl-sn-glycerol-3-phosphate acyltransferase
MYRIVMVLVWPVVRLWGRLNVVGLDLLPASGPVFLFANHDSGWDPLVIGVAALPRREVRALAVSGLWQRRPIGWVLDRMGQIPIERGLGDTRALAAAVTQLNAGACIGIFPEGTVSHGRALRVRSGAGRLALAVPEARVIGVAVTGAVDVARFPKRPRVRVEFFAPEREPDGPAESAAEFTNRVMGQVRDKAPVATARPRRTALKSRDRQPVSRTR